MPFWTVEGTYRNGRVELAERPEGLGASAPVLVTFLPPADAGAKGGPSPKEVRRAAQGRLLALLREGLPAGGPPYPPREELHERANLFDAAAERDRDRDRPRDG